MTLSASPTSVASGASSTLTWSTTNATGCTASGGWSGGQGDQRHADHRRTERHHHLHPHLHGRGRLDQPVRDGHRDRRRRRPAFPLRVEAGQALPGHCPGPAVPDARRHALVPHHPAHRGAGRPVPGGPAAKGFNTILVELIENHSVNAPRNVYGDAPFARARIRDPQRGLLQPRRVRDRPGPGEGHAGAAHAAYLGYDGRFPGLVPGDGSGRATRPCRTTVGMSPRASRPTTTSSGSTAATTTRRTGPACGPSSTASSRSRRPAAHLPRRPGHRGPAVAGHVGDLAGRQQHLHRRRAP